MEQQKNRGNLFHRRKRNGQKNNKSHQSHKKDSNNTLITAYRRRPRREKTVQRTSFPEGAVPDIEKPVISENQLSVKDNVTSLPRVYTDIYDEHTQQIVSFDDALQLIHEREKIEEDESIIYAGAGNFAVVKTEGKGADKQQTVVRKIEFERMTEQDNWREPMSFKISLPHIPKPQPLSELYTDEEIANFKLKR